MKIYWFYYWFNANITTECYLKANSQEDAVKKFIAMKGNKEIINMAETDRVA